MATQDLYAQTRKTAAQIAASPSPQMTQTVQRLSGTQGMGATTSTAEFQAQSVNPQGAQTQRWNSRRVAQMNPIQRAQFTEQQIMANESSLTDSPRYRVNIRNSVGPAADSTLNADRQVYSPAALAVMDKARSDFKNEFANLMSGSNKQAFTTLEDYERAINGLPSVQRYGGLMEDLVQQTARGNVSPVMEAQFQATDQNSQSFVRWAKQNGMAVAGQSDADLADQYFENPQMRQMFEADPNAPKFDVMNGKVMQREATPQEQYELQNRNETAQVKAQWDRVRASGREGEYEADPVTGQPVRKAQTITPQQGEAIAATRTQAYKAAGIDKTVIALPTADGGVELQEFDTPKVGRNMGNDAFRSLDRKMQESVLLDYEKAKFMAENIDPADPSATAAANAAKATMASLDRLYGPFTTPAPDAKQRAADVDAARAVLAQTGATPDQMAKAREILKLYGEKDISGQK